MKILLDEWDRNRVFEFLALWGFNACNNNADNFKEAKENYDRDAYKYEA